MKQTLHNWSVLAPDYPPHGALGRGLDVKASRACQLADTLAWAVGSGIPLPDALRSLPFYRAHSPERLEALKWVAWMLTPTFYWLYNPWLNDLRWTERINHVIEDLDKGLELGPTLQWWLGRFVPPFYLQGLMRAESDQRLETALPILAEQMAYPLTVTRRRFLAMLTAIIQVLLVSWVLLFLYTFIVPRIEEIASDMGGSMWMPALPVATLTSLGVMLMGATLWALGFLLLPRLGQWGDSLSHRIPWVGPNRRRFLILDATRTLCAYLRQGDDLLTAAVQAQQATPSHWLKRRLQRFIQALQRGEPWLDAWQQARLGKKLELWALRNAEAREDPAAGFELVADWTHQRIEAGTARMERWVTPITSLVLGAGVGVVGITFFRFLAMIIQHEL